MRTGWAVGLAGLGAAGGVAVGLVMGLALSARGDAMPVASERVPAPLPEQGVIYNGRRMAFAEAQRLHAAAASSLPKGWTLQPLPNPNEWVAYRGLRMTWAQLWEAAHCEQRLAAAEASAPAVMIAAPEFEEFQRKQAARTAAMEQAELMRQDARYNAELTRQAVRDELRRQELLKPFGSPQ